MNATEYMKHWEKAEIWTHYKWPKHQKRFGQIASMCEGKDCADVGCCFGHSTHLLGQLYPANWTGIEFDEKAIEKARELFPQYNFSYIYYQFLGMPSYPRFDTVVCSEVIEHIEDDKSFVKWLMAFKRIKLILTTPNRHVDDPGHLRIYNPDMIEDLLGDFSYIIKSIGGYYFMEVR